ncbi:hypothetical protein ACWEWG_15425 [Streptomyces sp. NPDC003758]
MLRRAARSSRSPGPGHGFCAVTIDELQQAVHGAQFGNDFPLFVPYGAPGRGWKARKQV